MVAVTGPGSMVNVVASGSPVSASVASARTEVVSITGRPGGWM